MTQFIRFKSNTDGNSDLYMRELGQYYAEVIKKIAAGGIEAASVYAYTRMGGVTKHHRSTFPERLLELCKNAGDIKPYKIVNKRLVTPRLTWHFKSLKNSMQVPVIEYL